MKSQKSAKDIAFENERAKFRKQIRELELSLSKDKYTISTQEEKIASLEEEISTLKEWIERLLEYTELSKEEMKEILDKEKTTAKVMNQMGFLFDLFPQTYFKDR